MFHNLLSFDGFHALKMALHRPPSRVQLSDEEALAERHRPFLGLYHPYSREDTAPFSGGTAHVPVKVYIHHIYLFSL